MTAPPLAHPFPRWANPPRSSPRRGKVGVGASAATNAESLANAIAPIPAFPQKGKELDSRISYPAAEAARHD